MNKRIKHFIFSFAFVIITFGCNKNYENSILEFDPYPDIEIPVISTGYNIKKFVNKPKGTKSVNYFIKVEYPATNILEFYDRRFKEMGWGPSSKDNFGKRNWECFIDDTVNGSPKVKQLLALWVDKEMENEALLALRYRMFPGGSWNDELWIVCQIQPVINFKEIDHFFEELKKSGEYIKFMELLDKYRLDDGSVDFDKAVEENIDNKNLLDYYGLIRDIQNEKGDKNN